MAMRSWRFGHSAAIQLSKQRPNRSGSTRLTRARSQRAPGMPWWKGEKRRRTARGGGGGGGGEGAKRGGGVRAPGNDVVEVVAGGDGRAGDQEQHLMEGVEHAPRLAGIVEGGELFQEQAQAVARQVRAGTDLADVGRKGVGVVGAGGHGRAPCRIRSRHGNTPSVSPQETGPPSHSSKFQAVVVWLGLIDSVPGSGAECPMARSDLR